MNMHVVEPAIGGDNVIVFGKPTILFNDLVRFRIPAGATLEFEESVPARITVPLGDGQNLIITGKSQLLSAVNLETGDLVQGEFTVRYRGNALRSVTLYIESARFHPDFELKLEQVPGAVFAMKGKELAFSVSRLPTDLSE